MSWKVGPISHLTGGVESSPNIPHPPQPPSKQIFCQLFFCSWLISAPVAGKHAPQSTLSSRCPTLTTVLWKLNPFPLLAPHWVTPELRVPSDSVRRLPTLNPSSGAQAFVPLPLSTWGCGGSHFSGCDSRCPARGTQAYYARPGCLGSSGQASQCEARRTYP